MSRYVLPNRKAVGFARCARARLLPNRKAVGLAGCARARLLARRSFLRAIGAAAGYRTLLVNLEARAAGPLPVKRFMVIHHPVGTVRAAWLPTGTETDFTLSRILKPFEPVRSHMVVLDGVDLVCRGRGGAHEQGTVTLMTGVTTTRLYPGNGGDDPYAEGPSVDQIFLKASPDLEGTPLASLQVSCDDRVDAAEVSTRRLSYAAAATPMPPYLAPHLAYERLFGTLTPGSIADIEALRQARLQQKSVLDFGLGHLGRLRTLAPASERERLDAHEAAIRELEKELDRAPADAAGCGLTEKPPVLRERRYGTPRNPGGDDAEHDLIGRWHLAIVRAAFRCDLTRVVTFQWSPGTNHVAFKGLYPTDPLLIKEHHPLSHEPNTPEVMEYLTRVEEWYSTRTAAFLQALKETKDPFGEGSLLDNTLVPYVTEVAEKNHSFRNTPVVVFGGRGAGLVGNRFKRFSRRPINDMWLACAKALRIGSITALGDQSMYTGPLPMTV